MKFVYQPPPGRYVPGYKPGQVVEAFGKEQIAALRANPCFKRVRKGK